MVIRRRPWMSNTADQSLTYFRGRWPDDPVPEGEPLWLLYEVDMATDNVLRTVDLFPEGRIESNSIEIDQPDTGHFKSLIDISFIELLRSEESQALKEITKEEFERLYAEGIDKPFWFT